MLWFFGWFFSSLKQQLKRLPHYKQEKKPHKSTTEFIIFILSDQQDIFVLCLIFSWVTFKIGKKKFYLIKLNGKKVQLSSE